MYYERDKSGTDTPRPDWVLSDTNVGSRLSCSTLKSFQTKMARSFVFTAQKLRRSMDTGRKCSKRNKFKKDILNELVWTLAHTAPLRFADY